MPELLGRDEIGAIRYQLQGGQPVHTSEYEDTIARAILDTGALQLGAFDFPDGPSNNKLHLERLFDPSNVEQRAVVLTALGRLACTYHADGVYGIPPNGELFAAALGEILDVPVIGLGRTRLSSGRKAFNLSTIDGQECQPGQFDQFQRLLAVKDVSATYGSVEDCLRSPFLAGQTVAAVVLWARGEMPPYDSAVWDFNVSLQALVHWPIAHHLDPGHELYEYARPARGTTNDA